MSKVVRWQAYFASLSGIQYRVDIYDEGYTGNVVTITLGASPFETDEDSTDDYFASVRPQTGVLRILDEDGTLMDDIMPTDNLARPMRVVKVSSSKVEWQGFLSCEAYSQEYTDRPNIININCNSVLAAMNSVEMDIREDMLFNTQLSHITYAIKTIHDKSGMSMVNKVYVSNVPNLFNYIYINSYFEADEVVSGENVAYDIHSISCQEMLSRICKYWGLVVRECGRDLYIMANKQSDAGKVYSAASLISDMSNGCVNVDEEDLFSTYSHNVDEIAWTGTDHKKTVNKGARRVIVKANVQKWDMQIKVPETPYSWIASSPESRWANWGEVHANTKKDFHTQCTFQALNTTLKVTKPSGTPVFELVYNGKYTAQSYYTKSLPWQDNEYANNYKDLVDGLKVGTFPMYPCSYLCHYRDSEDNIAMGLMISSMPGWIRCGDVQSLQYNKFALNANNYLYKQTQPLPFSSGTGWININANIGMVIYNYGKWYTISYNYFDPRITCAVKFGNKWWNGEEWSDTFSTFLLKFDNTGCVITNKDDTMETSVDGGLFLPVTERMTGEVSFYIYHEIGIWNKELDASFAVILRNVEVKYAPLDEDLKSNRSENGYVSNLAGKFDDVIDYDVELVSDAFNDQSANMLYDSNSTPIKYDDSNDATKRRPELRMLDRLSSFYASPKKSITIETNLIGTDVPVFRIDWYQDQYGNSKRYIPAAVSNDWANDKSTVLCFETE